MKVSEAEKLVCPFMSGQWGTEILGAYQTTCITTKCMAWKTTKTHETAYMSSRELTKQDCEGFCQRLR